MENSRGRGLFSNWLDRIMISLIEDRSKFYLLFFLGWIFIDLVVLEKIDFITILTIG